ncbi:hypothetical protein O6H91_15G044400 [Diphasiastrum complanatum]|uniref:Uncharacterized protein n=1 Tax=Diphasiastrum complanatum TaxID=34168 RepID=A0ACC2BHQ6_DIPCM|nr:hypothetical protein O6H91_15G044400 [Diphasiastrum complanatum]
MADMYRLPSRRETWRRSDQRDPTRRQGSLLQGLFSSSGVENRQVFPGPPKFESPSVQITSLMYTLINLDRAEMEIQLEMNNPNRVNCNLSSIDIVVESNDRKILKTKHERELTIRPNLTESLKVTLPAIEYKTILSSYPDVKRGQVLSYTVKVSPAFKETSTIPKLTAEKSGELPIPLEPRFHVKKLNTDQVSVDQCSVRLQMKVENKNNFDITVLKNDYEVVLSGNKVMKASATPNIVIKSNESRTVEFPVSLWPKEFGAALWNILRGRGCGLNIHWTMEADTLYGRMHL